MAPVIWKISQKPVPYEIAMREMDKCVEAIIKDEQPEMVWFLEHPPIYTAGTSANPSDLLSETTFPTYQSGRGGQYTYHGPGQLVGYVMLDLRKRKQDVRWFVQEMEAWLMGVLQELGVHAHLRKGRVGLWVNPKTESTLTIESKIAAIGIRVRKWVSFHGFALNVAPDLQHYEGIVPCGISNFGITSLADLGKDISIWDVQKKLRDCFETYFLAA